MRAILAAIAIVPATMLLALGAAGFGTWTASYDAPRSHDCYAPCTVHFADNVAEDNYREDFTRTRDGAPVLVVTTTTKGR